MMGKQKILAVALMALHGCATLAPTTHELNKRSGLAVGTRAITETTQLKNNRITKAIGSLDMPTRQPARIAKIWVYDQLINTDVWLRGTWLFMETEQVRWLSPVANWRSLRTSTSLRRERLK